MPARKLSIHAICPHPSCRIKVAQELSRRFENVQYCNACGLKLTRGTIAAPSTTDPSSAAAPSASLPSAASPAAATSAAAPQPTVEERRHKARINDFLIGVEKLELTRTEFVFDIRITPQMVLDYAVALKKQFKKLKNKDAVIATVVEMKKASRMVSAFTAQTILQAFSPSPPEPS